MTRVFEGIEITEEFLKELKQEWHQNAHLMPTSFENFVRANTGFSHEEFIQWCANGRIPNDQ